MRLVVLMSARAVEGRQFSGRQISPHFPNNSREDAMVAVL